MNTTLTDGYDQGDKNLGSVGGRGGSATPGGYNQGNMIAAQCKSGNGGVGSWKDLRGGTADSGDYNQGDMYAASTGGGKSIPGKSMGEAARTGKPGSAKESVGYTQGDQFAAKVGR